MSHTIRRHRLVRRDLTEIFVYIGQTRVSSARRYLREVEATFRRLAEFPGTGAQYDADDPRFEGIR